MAETSPEPAHQVNKPAGAATLAAFTVATIVGTAAVFLGHDRGLTAHQIAFGSFAAVIAASMLISWSAEAAQFLISQGLAVAIIALLQVLPEFMIEAVFAYRGDTPNMLANLTGSNRLLMGVGWPLIYVTAMVSHWFRTGKRLGPVVLRPENCIEVWALVVSSGWFLVIIWRGAFVIWDGFVLLTMFVGYLVLLSKLPPEEEGKEDLLAPSIVLVELPTKVCLSVIGVLLLLGGATMVLIANPFVDSMQVVAAAWGIVPFYFVQWVAPFLTEFPEKVTAFYWAKRVSTAPMALVNMVSSKVNQWTLLAAMVPIVYCFFSPNAVGGPFERVVPVADQTRELWLSVAMTMYGAACLLKRRFTGVNCAILLALWLVQFVNPEPAHVLIRRLGPVDFTSFDMRALTSWVFAGLAVFELVWHGLRGNIHPIADVIETRRLMHEGNRHSDVAEIPG